MSFDIGTALEIANKTGILGGGKSASTSGAESPDLGVFEGEDSKSGGGLLNGIMGGGGPLSLLTGGGSKTDAKKESKNKLIEDTKELLRNPGQLPPEQEYQKLCAMKDQLEGEKKAAKKEKTGKLIQAGIMGVAACFTGGATAPAAISAATGAMGGSGTKEVLEQVEKRIKQLEQQFPQLTANQPKTGQSLNIST